MIRSETALSVIMGGTGTELADIPTQFLGYQDNILENVNARAISLYGQFQDAAGFEEFVNSQDSIAQVASAVASRGENFQDVVMGGSSTTLSAIPDSVMNSVSDKIIMMGQVDSKVIAAATATGATMMTPAASTFDDTIQTSQIISDATENAVSQMTDSVTPVTSSVEQAFTALADNVAPAKAAAVDAVTSSGAESSNKVVALIEKTVLSFDDLAEKSGDSLEDAAKQLSDQLYQSFGSIDSAQASIKAAPKFIAQQGDVALQGALDEANRVFESGTSKLVEKGTETLQTAKQTPVKAVLSNVIHVIEDVMKVILKTADGLLAGSTGSSFAGHVQHFQASLTGLVGSTIQKMDSAISDVGKVNLQQVAKFVLQEAIWFIEGLTKIFVSLLDALLTSFTGNTLMGHAQNSLAGVSGAIGDSTQQLTSAINDIGQINVQEMAHLLVSLVTFVAKIMFQVFSAIVVVLSGQGIDEWTLQATGAAQQELRQISLQASDAAMGVMESSFTELGSLMIQLLESTSALVVEGLQALLESLGLLIQTGGPLSGAMATDAVNSVTDGISMMTANL